MTEDEMVKAVVAHEEILKKINSIGTKILERKKGNKGTEVWLIRRAPEEHDFIEVT